MESIGKGKGEDRFLQNISASNLSAELHHGFYGQFLKMLLDFSMTGSGKKRIPHRGQFKHSENQLDCNRNENNFNRFYPQTKAAQSRHKQSESD
jgi:hypothetical protein